MEGDCSLARPLPNISPEFDLIWNLRPGFHFSFPPSLPCRYPKGYVPYRVFARVLPSGISIFCFSDFVRPLAPFYFSLLTLAVFSPMRKCDRAKSGEVKNGASNLNKKWALETKKRNTCPLENARGCPCFPKIYATQSRSQKIHRAKGHSQKKNPIAQKSKYVPVRNSRQCPRFPGKNVDAASEGSGTHGPKQKNLKFICGLLQISTC